jgi:hypothetical protein
MGSGKMRVLLRKHTHYGVPVTLAIEHVRGHIEVNWTNAEFFNRDANAQVVLVRV